MRSDEQVKETLDHLETEEPLQEAGKGKANGHGNGNDTTPVVEWPAEGQYQLFGRPNTADGIAPCAPAAPARRWRGTARSACAGRHCRRRPSSDSCCMAISTASAKDLAAWLLLVTGGWKGSPCHEFHTSKQEEIMIKLVRLAIVVGAFGLGWNAVGEAQAQATEKFRYHYVSLNAAVPPGFDFYDPAKIVDNGRIYGTAYACGPEVCLPSVTVYERGSMTVLHEGFANTANSRGTVGGRVILDFVNFFTQAALLVPLR